MAAEPGLVHPREVDDELCMLIHLRGLLEDIQCVLMLGLMRCKRSALASAKGENLPIYGGISAAFNSRHSTKEFRMATSSWSGPG
jgi:hypothetical protein